MVSIFSVDENNDIFATDSNRLAIARGLEAVLQQCQHAVEVRRGELLYARTQGIDYLSNVFSGSPNLLQFESEVRTAISRVASVSSVTDFEADITNNTLNYTVTIQTTFGTGVISGNI